MNDTKGHFFEKLKNIDRSRISRWFDIAFVLFLFSFLIENTAWYALDLSGTFYKVVLVIKCVAAVLCAVIILLKLIRGEYSKRMILVYLILLAVFALSLYFGRTKPIVWYFLLFAAVYGEDGKHVITISAIVTAVMLFVPIFCGFLGLAVNTDMGVENRVRYNLGFAWTTIAPMLFFFLILQLIFLRKQKMKIWEFLLLEGGVILFYYLTDSQMLFLVSTAVLAFFLVESLFKQHFRIASRFRWLWILMPFLMFAFVIAVHLLYTRFDIAFLHKMNTITHSRLWLTKKAFEAYRVTPFGQQIEWVGNYITSTGEAKYNYVDCSYFQILLNNGVFYLLSVLGIYSAGIYRASRKNDYYMVGVFVAILLISVTEPRLMNMCYNVLPLLAFCKLSEVETSRPPCVESKSL